MGSNPFERKKPERKPDTGKRGEKKILTDEDINKIPPMSLEERVEFFLRAVHGEREYTQSERAAAQARLLGWPGLSDKDSLH